MNTSQDDASQAGASLLSTFVSARNASRSAKKGKVDDANLDMSISMYFDAVADGNNVVSALVSAETIACVDTKRALLMMVYEC